jgi:hypothetical protein
MRHNLTAVSNNCDEAQHVSDELLVFGYARSRITHVSALEAGNAGALPVAGHGDTVKRMLARLFGFPYHELERVGEPAFLPRRHVVTLARATDLDCAQAIGIIENSNPV